MRVLAVLPLVLRAGAPVSAGDLAGEPASLKPSLYVLAVGVSDYADGALKLGFAAKDARDFGAALAAQQGGLYGVVRETVITDREATRARLIDGLKWLRKQVTSRDVGIVFLAGRGMVDAQGRFWFLPADGVPQNLGASAVSQADIRQSLEAVAGKAVLFLDPCRAGQVAAGGGGHRCPFDINEVLANFVGAEDGIVTFASSTGREMSEERDAWGNGAFAKALIEGLAQGKADLLGHGTITLSELDYFIADRVKELTEGEQHPVMTRLPTVPDYPIAVARK